jgi:tetrahydromethanopterin S-methyltransferase subunit C
MMDLLDFNGRLLHFYNSIPGGRFTAFVCAVITVIAIIMISNMVGVLKKKRITLHIAKKSSLVHQDPTLWYSGKR